MISNFHVQVEHMISEKNILSSLDHPFIVRLAGTFQGGGIMIRFNSSSCTLVIYYAFLQTQDICTWSLNILLAGSSSRI